MSIIIDGTNGISDIDGTASTPAIRGTDTNTGIFFPAADTIAFAEGGTEVARIDSSGNLNIGTTGYGTYFSSNKNISLGEGATIRASASGGDPYITISSNAYFTNTPDWKYVVTDFASSYEQYNGTHVWSSAASGTAGNTITFTERMRIDSSGNVGIGTSSPVANNKLTIDNGANAYGLIIQNTGGNDAGFQLRPNGTTQFYFTSNTNGNASMESNGATVFRTNSAERARITSGGQMSLISTVDGLHVGSTQASGTSYWLYRGASAATAGTANSGTDRFFVFTNGNVTNSNGSYGTISDAKLKQDIIDAGSQWADIKNLRFRKYRMKSDVAENPNAPYLLGFVAQELETISPGLIEEHPDTTIETKTREVEKTREIPAVLDDEGNEVTPAITETYTETEEYTETVDLGTTTKSIKTSILYMKAVKALQEAMNRIETLEAEVAALKAKE